VILPEKVVKGRHLNLDQGQILRIDQKEHHHIAEAAVAAEVVKVQVTEAVQAVAIVQTTIITITRAIQILTSSNYKSICNSQRNSNNLERIN